MALHRIIQTLLRECTVLIEDSAALLCLRQVLLRQRGAGPQPTDVWAAGVVLWALVGGGFAFLVSQVGYRLAGGIPFPSSKWSGFIQNWSFYGTSTGSTSTCMFPTLMLLLSLLRQVAADV